MPTSRLTLVIPCYNEAERLPSDRLAEWVSAPSELPVERHLLLVDDGSTDDTARVLRDLAARDPARIAHLSLPRNRGKAEAVRQGLLRALDEPADLVGYWDADLATPLDEVDRMIRLFDRRPSPLVVMGSRVQLLGRHIDRNPLRHYVGRVFATAASLVLRAPVYDTQCGAKLLRPSEPVRRALCEPFQSGWVFDVELLARLGDQLGPDALTTLVVEHPLRRWEDVRGSKVKPLDFPLALGHLARIALRDRHAPASSPSADARSDESAR